MDLSNKAKKLKILAPAGDWECLIAAIEAGADSIYFGISDFNMRSTAAKNFQIDDIPQIVKKCKKHNIETYITVNTIMYNSDLTKMKEIISCAKKNHCNGVIVSDFAAILYAKKISMPTVISTQLSVSNIDAVRFFAKYANRIILARELTLEQVKEIIEQIAKEKIKGMNGKLVEIEIFGHGALCVAISGRCNMSLYCYNTSANKGQCAQICRRAYKVVDMETDKVLKIDNNYIMSPKDLCTIGLLPQIIDTGVKVLKLEGRGRPAEYVDTTVKAYKKAVNAIINKKYNPNLVKKLNKELGTVFNRGLSEGMYMGRNFSEWAKGAGNQAKTRRIHIGKVANFFTKKNVALIEMQSNIKILDGMTCLITGAKTGLVRFKLKNIIVNKKTIKSIKNKTPFTIKIPKQVRKNDDVYIITKNL